MGRESRIYTLGQSWCRSMPKASLAHEHAVGMQLSRQCVCLGEHEHLSETGHPLGERRKRKRHMFLAEPAQKR